LKVSEDGKTLEGETVGSVVDGVRKAELLDVIAQLENVTKEQVFGGNFLKLELWLLTFVN
jgi:phosphoserine phosphatase